MRTARARCKGALLRRNVAVLSRVEGAPQRVALMLDARSLAPRSSWRPRPPRDGPALPRALALPRRPAARGDATDRAICRRARAPSRAADRGSRSAAHPRRPRPRRSLRHPPRRPRGPPGCAPQPNKDRPHLDRLPQPDLGALPEAREQRRHVTGSSRPAATTAHRDERPEAGGSAERRARRRSATGPARRSDPRARSGARRARARLACLPSSPPVSTPSRVALPCDAPDRRRCLRREMLATSLPQISQSLKSRHVSPDGAFQLSISRKLPTHPPAPSRAVTASPLGPAACARPLHPPPREPDPRLDQRIHVDPRSCDQTDPQGTPRFARTSAAARCSSRAPRGAPRSPP